MTVPPAPTCRARHARPLLLIVDDDQRSGALLGLLLRGDGYDTEVELDGAAALERLVHAPTPDAVITDFHLPGANGLVVGRHAQARRAGIPVFMVTGDPHSVESASGAEDASVEVLTKPIDYASLVRRLRAAIPGRA